MNDQHNERGLAKDYANRCGMESALQPGFRVVHPDDIAKAMLAFLKEARTQPQPQAIDGDVVARAAEAIRQHLHTQWESPDHCGYDCIQIAQAALATITQPSDRERKLVEAAQRAGSHIEMLRGQLGLPEECATLAKLNEALTPYEK